MRTIGVAATSFALAGAALLLSWAPAGAHWRGGLHISHHGARSFSPYSFYGGYVATPSYVPEPVISPAVSYVAAPVLSAPPRTLTCQRSQQVMTVPAEAGGTREITVTRC